MDGFDIAMGIVVLSVGTGIALAFTKWRKRIAKEEEVQQSNAHEAELREEEVRAAQRDRVEEAVRQDAAAKRPLPGDGGYFPPGLTMRHGPRVAPGPGPRRQGAAAPGTPANDPGVNYYSDPMMNVLRANDFDANNAASKPAALPVSSGGMKGSKTILSPDKPDSGPSGEQKAHHGDHTNSNSTPSASERTQYASPTTDTTTSASSNDSSSISSGGSDSGSSGGGGDGGSSSF